MWQSLFTREGLGRLLPGVVHSLEGGNGHVCLEDRVQVKYISINFK